ncbi:MAG: hypothetical protein U5L11_06380 [Arhodomonas sp.]|nr:hypothetical protein [Arhodomonas sp.]
MEVPEGADRCWPAHQQAEPRPWTDPGPGQQQYHHRLRGLRRRGRPLRLPALGRGLQVPGKLFDDDDPWRRRAVGPGRSAVGELLAFRGGRVRAGGRHAHGFRWPPLPITADCSGLRPARRAGQPRKSASSRDGLEFRATADTEICLRLWRHVLREHTRKISERLVDDKADRIVESGADAVLAGDLGCLMNIAGRLRRRGDSVRAFHTAEVRLAGMGQGPAIGEGGEER